MPITIFTNFTEKDKRVAVERLLSSSTPSQDYFLMIILSILTATFGLLADSSAVIVGSMLIAPLLYPILSLSLGFIMSDAIIITRSFWTILKSLMFGVTGSFFSALLFSTQMSSISPEIASRAEPSLIYLMVAIIAGFAATFALVKPQLNETLPGIAISVSLIPPIAVIGIGISQFNWDLISGSLLLFIVNAVGIVFASMITFSLMNFYKERTQAHKAVVNEEKMLSNEKKQPKK